MTELHQLTRPIVRRGTGFHADQAWRQRLEERHHLAAAELSPDDDLLGRIIAPDSVQSELRNVPWIGLELTSLDALDDFSQHIVGAAR